jgi:hypothetical protein
MQDKDPKLSGLLRQWQDVEPRPAFVPDVLRQIRLDAAARTAADEGGVFGFRAWFATVLKPLTVTVAAAFVGGVLLGVLSMIGRNASLVPAAATNGFGLLRAGTVSGNYVTFSSTGRSP